MSNDIYDYSHLPPHIRDYTIKRNEYNRYRASKWRAKKRAKALRDKFYE